MNVRFTPFALAIAVLASGCANQQGSYSGGPSLPPPAMSIPGTPASSAPVDSSQQAGYLKMPELESLVSPIALYPDALLSQMLLASTYPLEVAEATLWLRNNPKLSGQALQDALKSQNWSVSVKSLVALPDALNMLGSKLDWTQKLGDAYLAQPADLMQAVQSLRTRAAQAGNLKSNAQMTVSSDSGSNIVIVPANPQVVYMPAYNPAVVYGGWPYPAYPPYPAYDPAWGMMSFGVGMAVGASLWATPNWGSGSINVNNANFNNFNQRYNRGPVTPGDIQNQRNAANDLRNNATPQERDQARQAAQRAQSDFQRNATPEERSQASQMRQQGQRDMQEDRASPNAWREAGQENAMRSEARGDFNQDRYGGDRFGGDRFGGGRFGGGFGGGGFRGGRR